MEAETVRKSRRTRRTTKRTQRRRVPAAAVYLSFEEQESLKLRRRLKQRLATTKSTLSSTFRNTKKKRKEQKARKKILTDRKGQMAKQRAKQTIDNENRHLLKKILRLHYRKGDAATGTEEKQTGRPSAALKFHRHPDRKTSYMRQRYQDLSRISAENKRMIGKLISSKPKVEVDLDPKVQERLGGSMMRPGHMGIMRELSSSTSGASKTRKARPKSAPMNRRRSAVPEAKQQLFVQRQRQNQDRSEQTAKKVRPRSAGIHLNRRSEHKMVVEDEPMEIVSEEQLSPYDE